MKWWLISDEDVQVIKVGLLASTHRANAFNCEDWPIGEGCSGCRGDKLREDALHTLESGLNSTEAIPVDWKGG